MDIEPGTVLGGYVVQQKLASGGMATVYLVKRKDAGPNAPILALKAIPMEVLDPEVLGNDRFVRMFVDEALMASRIYHPNVVRVMELNQDAGHYFIVMEYVQGCSLAELMATLQKNGEWLTPEAAVWITIQTAMGLHAAHEVLSDEGTKMNIVHRDVSPQNILLSEDGKVKLADFGVAKALGRAEKTKTGVVKGKYRYMSPEQLFNKDVDHQSDLYALAVVLWEMLAGRRLWHGLSDLEVMHQLRAPKIAPPSTHHPGVDAQLERVLMEALSTDKTLRSSNLDVFRKKLAEVFPRAASGAAEIPELVAKVRAAKSKRDSLVAQAKVSREANRPADKTVSHKTPSYRTLAQAQQDLYKLPEIPYALSHKPEDDDIPIELSSSDMSVAGPMGQMNQMSKGSSGFSIQSAEIEQMPRMRTQRPLGLIKASSPWIPKVQKPKSKQAKKYAGVFRIALLWGLLTLLCVLATIAVLHLFQF